jgi:hypothetical protein
MCCKFTIRPIRARSRFAFSGAEGVAARIGLKMIFFKSIVVVAVGTFLFLVPHAVDAAQTKDVVQQVSGREKTIVIRDRTQAHEYDLDEDLQFSEIDSVKLLFESRANGKLFLLMHVTGPSTGGGNGQCGAGEEEYLVWMAFDDKWSKNDQKLQLISSCFQNIEGGGSDPYAIRNGKLVAEYTEYKENNESVKSTLTYDSAKPEKAWMIEHKPFRIRQQ